jgi:hypothetical protein
MLGIVLLYKIMLTIGLKSLVRKYTLEFALIAAYFFVCFLSLYLNSWRYQDQQELIRYGVTFIVITASFPAAIVLFALPQQNKGLSLTNFINNKQMGITWIPVGVMVFIAVLGVTQQFIPEVYLTIYPVFIAAEVVGSGMIRSVFRISTDFASICAIVGCIMLMFGLVYYKKLPKHTILLMLSCAFICLFAGVLSGKRVFLLTLLFTLVISCIYYYRERRKILLAGFVGVIIASHFFIIFGPALLSNRMGEILPYITYLTQFEWPPASSFTVELQQGAFQALIDLWGSALKMFNENPLVGVTNGGFRLANQYIEQNTHNVIFQVLIDAGVVGVALILSLISRFILFSEDKMLALLAVFFIFSCLLVDYFIDHSVPWVIVVAYFCTWYWRIIKNLKLKDLHHDT